MRIGITCHPVLGGSGAVAIELGRQLARRGHEVHFVSYRPPAGGDDFLQEVTLHSVDHASCGMFDYPPHDVALAAKMAEVSREQRLEVLHVHHAIPHAVNGVLVREMLGEKAPRLVTTLHGSDLTLVSVDQSFAEMTRFAIHHSNAVTAVSEFLRRMTVDELQAHVPIEVIPDFVDLAEFSPNRACPEAGALAGPGERILLHASNFRPGKRALDVIRIFELVGSELEAVLLMVGEGPERAAAQSLARRLGVQDRVRFLGTQESISEIAGAADVFVLPSETESFGLPALQAMACGVPVVGSDAGGLPEVVKHAESGYLLPVGDVEGMAGRTLEILKDRERRLEMGRAGRRRAEALFGAERVVGLYERLYEGLLAS
jgi:N-acetyl-alpha-D-glucosaminyl L-malate synthase BshA